MANHETSKEEPKQGKRGTAAAAAPSQQQSPQPQPAVAMTPPPETHALEVYDYGDDAGQGFENQDMSDRKLPLIELLQSNSPEVVDSKGKCWAGQFHNTVTGEIYE